MRTGFPVMKTGFEFAVHQDNKMNVGTQESPSNSKICFIIDENI